MTTFYLVDFENVHNEGIEHVTSLPKESHVHIFSTENALNIRMDIAFSKEVDIEGHIVPPRKQSLDMHLVSYLGYLLGIHGKSCEYVIISKDTDYDNVIKFWKAEGYENISRKEKIPKTKLKKEKTQETVKATAQPKTSAQSKASAPTKREMQIRSFFGQHFKKKIYVEQKEEIVRLLMQAKSRQQINNGLMKLYADNQTVKHIYQTLQPLIRDLPGR